MRAGALGTHVSTHATAPTPTPALSGRGGRAAGGRGGGGRGVRRRRPGEGRGRGAASGGRGARKKAAFNRSRDFVLKVRGMSHRDWQGVLEALEKAEETEESFGKVRERERGSEWGGAWEVRRWRGRRREGGGIYRP